MSLHPTRKAAERFHALIEGDRPDAVDPGTAELLDLVRAVGAIPAPTARPEFVASLREQLMAAAETELVGPDGSDDLDRRLTLTPRRSPRERRLALALGGFAIIGATTSMAVAAQSALPGDALYPIKRALENAEAGFRISDDAKGQTILANASGRLDEVDQLASQGDGGNATDIEQTLDTFSEQASEAGDLLLADYENTGSEDSISDLRSFTSSSIQALSALEDVIPAEAQAALLNAAQVIFTIDAAAAAACPACTDAGIGEIPPQLLASGGQALDDAAAALAALAEQSQAPAKPEPKPGKGDQPTVTDGAGDPGGAPSPSGDAPDGSGQGQNPGAGVGVGDGKGDKKNKPVDLGPVTDVVDEVVEDIGEILGGLGGNN